MTPLVSVIVPCRNETAFVARCLQSILANDYPSDRMEVIVADGMSSDGTRDVLARLASSDPRLRIIDNPVAATPAALNRAIAASRGEVLVRFDGHAVMPPDYIRKCVGLLLSSGAANVGGTIRTRAQTEGRFSSAIAAALGSRFGVGDSSFRTGAQSIGPVDTVFGGCWRRELFATIGGFNERLHRSQDIEFNLRIRRAGGIILLDPSIVCDYYARARLGPFLRHNFSNGRWAILPFALSDQIAVRARHLIPLTFVTSLAISPFLPFPWSIAAPAAYATANLIASGRLAWSNRKPAYLASMPLAFAALHLAYGLGSVCGVLEVLARKYCPRTGVLLKHASRTET